MNRIPLLLTIASLVTGCHKPLPSPDFIEASGRYTDLVAMQADAAFATPQMDEVVAQLGRVKERSSDYPRAHTLIDTIARERARIEAARVANAKLLEKPTGAPTFPTLNRPPPHVEEAVVAAEQKPAGDPFAVVTGAAWLPLQQKFVGCFVSRGPVTLSSADGGNRRETESFELASPDCAARVPALATSVALVMEGKIVTIAPKSSVVTTVLPAPAGAPVAPTVARLPVAAPAPVAPTPDPVLAPIKY